MEFIHNTLQLYLSAAPWLLFGLLLAALVHVWIPEQMIQRWLGGEGLLPVVRAAIVGAPLPLCSCGVIPAALGVRRSGASRSATVSFLIATPETGVDSVSVTYALLGPVMAIVRPIAAILTGIVAGTLTLLIPEGRTTLQPPPGVGVPIKAVTTESSDESCCSSGPTDRLDTPLLSRLNHSIHYVITDILDGIFGWLLIGLLVAGAVMTLFPPMLLAQWGGGLPAMVVMLLAGIPIYICATASTPLAAALLVAGVSPGAVLVFMLSGPATNLSTLGVVHKEFGRNTVIAYLGGIAITAVGLGLLLDEIATSLGFMEQIRQAEIDELFPVWFSALCGVLLMGIGIRPLRSRLSIPGQPPGQSRSSWR